MWVSLPRNYFLLLSFDSESINVKLFFFVFIFLNTLALRCLACTTLSGISLLICLLLGAEWLWVQRAWELCWILSNGHLRPLWLKSVCILCRLFKLWTTVACSLRLLIGLFHLLNEVLQQNNNDGVIMKIGRKLTILSFFKCHIWFTYLKQGSLKSHFCFEDGSTFCTLAEYRGGRSVQADDLLGF